MVDSVPEIIKELVERFDSDKHIYKSSYDEENTKIEFINPFFEALGWDVHNKMGSSVRFKDVVFEDTIHINGKSKAPDYSFRCGGQKVFFVEAKKPMVNIKQDKKAAFQIKRYCWSADLPLCILTNFEELAVYEKTKPNKNHNASIGRIKYYKYTDYVEKWDEIVSIFSKEAVRTGKFDNFVTGHQGIKKGTSEVDEEFLKEIENWRLILTKNISNRNKELPIEKLNHAVQLTIDRIIFLRIAEDRGIEKYKQLKDLLELSNDNKDEYPVYEGFIEICKKADVKYNSGLFHFKEEKGISLSADELTPNLKIDDGTFKQIFKNIYYPNCPYEFSVLPTEVLGNVYERFLGSKIRLTKSNKPKIEYKSEVKKAGGVFYTPQYIVDFIVENTIGVLLKGKTPNQVSKMRFVDPACGSGSFLLGAFQCLIDWHIKYYSGLKKPPKDVIYTGKDGITRLTVREKKRIVLNNIYGVDIDPQAVEVSKLSLLLKVLEDSNKDELEAQQKLFQERALPYLGDNIKCGNTLIGTDILEQDLEMDEIAKINPFDWEEEFKKVFENGGFDAVIGNPPYVGEKGNKEIFHAIKKTEWGKQYYQSKMDLFYYFYHKGIDICKNNGLISFITTNYFLTADGANNLRRDFKERTAILKMVNCNELQIFENAKGQHNLITVLSKSLSNKMGKIYSIQIKGKSNSSIFKKLLDKKIEGIVYSKISQNEFYNGEDNVIFLEGHVNENDISSSLIGSILKKMENETYLKEILNINAGADITISKITKKHIQNYSGNFTQGEGVFVLTDKELKNKGFPEEELEIVKPFIKNSDIFKYYIKKPSKSLIYTNQETDINKYPNIKEHLKRFKKIFTDQMKRYNENYSWFMIHRPREEKIFNLPRIVLPYRSKENRFAYADTPIYASRDVFFLTSKDNKVNLFYILSLLNSKLYYIWLYYRGKRKGETLELYATPVGKIPIKIISKDKQEQFINLADKMLKLNKQLFICKTPNEKRLLENQIKFIDNKIDQLVYKLYKLTDEEIEIVENSLK